MKEVWKVLAFDMNKGEPFKGHLMPSELWAPIKKDLEERGGIVDLAKSQVVDRPEPVHFEPGSGGMRLMGWPQKEFELDGLRLEVDYCDVETLLIYIKNSPLRHAGGVPYYKIHGPWTCLVLDPARTKLLQTICERDLEEAQTITDKFWDDWKEWVEYRKEMDSDITREEYERRKRN